MILAISDVHKGPEQLDEYSKCPDKESVELLLILGDFTSTKVPPNSEQAVRDWEKLAANLRELYPNAIVIFIPGNHDPKDEVIEEYGPLDLPANVHRLKNGWSYKSSKFNIVAHTAVPKLQGEWNRECSPKELKKKADQLRDARMLISHAPPHGIVDRVIDGLHCGSPPLRDFIGSSEELEVVVCGHCHEESGKVEFLKRSDGERVKVYNVAEVLKEIR